MSPYNMALVLSIAPRALLERILFTTPPADNIGNGHPVMLLPGNGVSGKHMTNLADYLTEVGFDVYDWGFGTNRSRSHTGGEQDALVRRIDEISSASGRKVSLVGWSLGGALARIAATDHPYIICKVITIGTPFVVKDERNAIWQLFDTFKDLSGQMAEIEDMDAKMARPIPVPSVSIYSKYDGMVAWQNCIDPNGLTEAVQVGGTHVGFMHNREVFEAVAAYLASTPTRH